MMDRDINDYQTRYVQQAFEPWMVRFRKRKIREILSRYQHETLLEVGCGLESIFLEIESYKRLVVVEPGETFYSKAMADRANKPGRDITVIRGLLESVRGMLAEESFDFILLSGLLHEVANPDEILATLYGLCRPDTVVHINVPNAQSFHRLLAVEMGLIPNAFQKSELNLQLQHHTVYDLERLRAAVTGQGFEVIEHGSYLIKPFTHAQMQTLLDSGLMTERMLEGLYGMEKHMPGLGSEIFVNVRKRPLHDRFDRGGGRDD
jgi:2-polyprenyl-3-methyl-5-hydroxy-6-metoxy-1,4-benzoquinol methylase